MIPINVSHTIIGHEQIDHQVLHFDQQLRNIECYHLYHGLTFNNDTLNVKVLSCHLFVVPCQLIQFLQSIIFQHMAFPLFNE